MHLAFLSLVLLSAVMVKCMPAQEEYLDPELGEANDALDLYRRYLGWKGEQADGDASFGAFLSSVVNEDQQRELDEPVIVSARAFSDQCLQCIRRVEGGRVGVCNWDVYSYSCGPYQLKEDYWKDGGRQGGDWQTCTKQETCSQNTVRAYMNRYGRGCGSNPTCESYLRMHNGGPSGCKVGTKMYTATNGYWNKAKRLCGL